MSIDAYESTQTPKVISDLLSAKARSFMDTLDATDKQDVVYGQEGPVRGFESVGNIDLLIPLMGANREEVITWINTTVAELPLQLVDGIKQIDVQDWRSDQDPNSEWVGTGDMNLDDKTLRLYVGARLRALEQADEADKDTMRLIVKNLITETLLHEVTHYAHGNRMTLEMIREWERVISSDPVHVSEYVKHVHRDGEKVEGENFAAQEDLADSIKMYFSLPYTLMQKSEARYKYINELIGRNDEITLEMMSLVLNATQQSAPTQSTLH
jgi:hypothetical protein